MPKPVSRNGHAALADRADHRQAFDRAKARGSGSPVPGKKRGKRRRKDPGALAKEPELIEAIRRDIALLGLVGELESGLLVYVAYTSRILNEPMALCLRGKTGGGKSANQRKPLSMFPPEDVIDATSLTPTALYRMPPGSLEHKILVTGERKHANDPVSADANAALRQLLSERRISRLCSVKEDGQWTTKLIEQEGPVAYSETTTSLSIFSEDLNRMLQVRIDESEKQTRKIMQAAAQRYSIDEKTIDTKAIVDRHREFQSSLEHCDIRIPFADVLAEKMPAAKIEARRIIGQVFGVIETIALLQQFQRERDEQGRLIATVDDYAVARGLLLGPLHAAIGLGDKYKEAEALQRKLPKGEFTSQEARKAGGFKTKMTCSNHLNGLKKIGVLEMVQKAVGPRPAVWKWADSLEDSVLPSPKTVTREMERRVKA